MMDENGGEMSEALVRHLTEEERQGTADGTLAPELQRRASAHLARCLDCAADVGALRAFMTRVHMDEAPAGAIDDLWPAIRVRIQQGKAATLPQPGAAVTSSHGPRTRARVWTLATLLAAAVVLLVALLRSEPRHSAPAEAPPSRSTVVPVTLVDSSQAYQQQVATLLDELELRRAMLPPATVARVDHDLQTIDHAIAELREALVHDPNDPALRQLLAASLRQKRDLLQRVNDAS
jgi:hypothetical protein